MHVELDGTSTNYEFGPTTGGSTIAEHKPYLVVVTGQSAALSFEDLAGLPGCDYDYNDHSWGGVTVVPTDPPIVGQSSTIMALAGMLDAEDQVRLDQQVTIYNKTEYRWEETFTNTSTPYSYENPNSWYVNGANKFELGITNTALVLRTEVPDGWIARKSPNDYFGGLHPVLQWEGPPLMGGQSVKFVHYTHYLSTAHDFSAAYGTAGNAFFGDGLAPEDKPFVMITDKDGNRVGAGGLKVAKWENAFDIDNIGVARVKKVDQTTGYDIIDLDPDRFNVWVHDQAKWDNKIDEIPQFPHISVKISTKNVAGFEAYNDSANDVDLVRYTGPSNFGTGWYWSDSQMLVSNEVDDTANLPGIGADETGLGAEVVAQRSARSTKSCSQHTTQQRVAINQTEFVTTRGPLPAQKAN